jgi:F420H(2)-dependent quinone reductase
MSLANTMMKGFSRANVAVYRATKGRMGSWGGTTFLLTTTGRKTGKERTTPLMKLEQDDGYLVVASRAGSPKHPAWFLNLSHTPEVVVEIDGERRAMKAHVLPEEERVAAYARFVEFDKRFAAYQSKTTRKIPVVQLIPA